MAGIKLNIGSRIRAEGWKTLDIQAGPGVDYVGDCSALSQFASASIETIYASHVLEHISFRQIEKVLKEWRRVLQPGGTLMVAVPDMDAICRLYVHPQTTPQDHTNLMMMMFGAQDDLHDFHHVGFNSELIAYYLHRADFEKITRVKEFGLFQDTSLWQFRGAPISLNVTAVKPA